jgi:hypothetical protein
MAGAHAMSRFAVAKWLGRRWWLVLIMLATLGYLVYFGFILPGRIFNGFD